MLIRVFVAIAAGIGAANTALLAYPADVVPQSVLVFFGALSAGTAAAASYLLSKTEAS